MVGLTVRKLVVHLAQMMEWKKVVMMEKQRAGHWVLSMADHWAVL